MLIIISVAHTREGAAKMPNDNGFTSTAETEIVPFELKYADTVYDIQRKAYFPLFIKYNDIDTNPYCESKEVVLAKYTRHDTDGYLFMAENAFVGCVRIVKEGAACRVSALAVLPEFRNRGIAQSALAWIEKNYPEIKVWRLDTIEQEKGNCRLYEKLGYKRTGAAREIKEGMTLVDYVKMKD